MTDNALGFWGPPIAILSGAIRVSTPFLFVSLGECITERSGRINLGLEGILVMGAMTAYAVSYVTGNPWVGVLAAAGAGGALGIVHGLVCSLPYMNWYTTSDRPGAVKSWLRRTFWTGASPALRSRGPSRKT